MGSTGPDFRCPLCGRRGRAGYAMDGVGYPVCSSGDDPTCVKKIDYQGKWPNDILVDSLAIVFCRSKPEHMVGLLAPYICPRGW